MKKDKIIFWVFTGFIFLFDTVMPALTSHTEIARQGISHLGYPDYFRVMLTVFKIGGGILLVLPAIPQRLKEWAYAGFTFNYVCAFVSLLVVDGLSAQTLFPLLILGFLAVSYIYNRKLQRNAFKLQLA